MDADIGDVRFLPQAFKQGGQLTERDGERVAAGQDQLGDFRALAKVGQDSVDALFQRGQRVALNIAEHILAKAVHAMPRAFVGDQKQCPVGVFVDQHIAKAFGHVGLVFDKIGDFMGGAQVQPVGGRVNHAVQRPVQMSQGCVFFLHQFLIRRRDFYWQHIQCFGFFIKQLDLHGGDEGHGFAPE